MRFQTLVTEAMKAAGTCCSPPIVTGLTSPVRPDWTCGYCGRRYRDVRESNGVQWWAEIRGRTA